MSTKTKCVLTAAVLTNPLVWFAAALAVMLACVGLGVLLLYGIYRWLRHECSIPARPKPVTRIDIALTEPSSGPEADVPLDMADPPPFGMKLARPVPVTSEQRDEVIAAERAEHAVPKPVPVAQVPALDGCMVTERLVVEAPRPGTPRPSARPRVQSSAARTAKPKVVRATKPKVSKAKKPKPLTAKARKA